MGKPDAWRIINAILLLLLLLFMCGRRQCTKIGDLVSEWCTINAGVPQGTLLGPVGFVVHINDLKSILDIAKYVDDSSVWEVYSKKAQESQLQQATDEAIQWSDYNLMRANCDKTKELLVDYSRKPTDIPCIKVKGKDIGRVTSTKLLGVTITPDLTWGEHVDNTHSRAAQRSVFLQPLDGFLPHCTHTTLRGVDVPVWGHDL
jgi:hypothetical protein